MSKSIKNGKVTIYFISSVMKKKKYIFKTKTNLLTNTKKYDNIQNINNKYCDEDRRFSKSFQRIGEGARPIISLKSQITSE